MVHGDHVSGTVVNETHRSTRLTCELQRYLAWLSQRFLADTLLAAALVVAARVPGSG